jgi:hypothetical protein
MRSAGLHEEIGVENIHVRMHDAVKACSHRLLGLVSRRSTVRASHSIPNAPSTIKWKLTVLAVHSEWLCSTLDGVLKVKYGQ